MRVLLISTFLLSALLLAARSTSAQDFLGKSTSTWAKELDRAEESARRNAAYALGKMGFQAVPAVPALLKRLRDDASAKVREAAAFALGEIGRESIKASVSQSMIPGLADALKDKHHLVRRS